MPECAFAHFGGCETETMAMAHLVPKSRLKTELRYMGLSHDEIQHAIWDPRCWWWMCGGVSKLGGHHGMYDRGAIRLISVPDDLREFLREYDLEWMGEAYIERHAPASRE